MSVQSLAFDSLNDFTVEDVLSTIQKKPVPVVKETETLEKLLKELEFYPQIPINNNVFTVKDLFLFLTQNGHLNGTVKDLTETFGKVQGITDHASVDKTCWRLDPLNHIYVLISLFSGSDFKHSCIVGDQIVLTQKDLLKFLYIQSKQNPHLKKLFATPLKDSLRRHVKVKAKAESIKLLDENSTIFDALTELANSGFGSMPVDTKPVKQLTTRSLGYAIENYHDLKTRKLKDLPLLPLNVIEREKTVTEAIEIMLEEGYRAIWVTNPIDVLTMTDIITLVYTEASQ